MVTIKNNRTGSPLWVLDIKASVTLPIKTYNSYLSNLRLLNICLLVGWSFSPNCFETNAKFHESERGLGADAYSYMNATLPTMLASRNDLQLTVDRGFHLMSAECIKKYSQLLSHAGSICTLLVLISQCFC